MLTINSIPDHLHLFFGFHTTQSLSGRMRLVKASPPNSSTKSASLQVFSYARQQVRAVIHYIEHQEEPHHNKTFQEEYREHLRDFAIPFEEHYIFQEPERVSCDVLPLRGKFPTCKLLPTDLGPLRAGKAHNYQGGFLTPKFLL